MTLDPQKETTVSRTYKATMFAMIFSEKKELLELYNAVNGTRYEDTDLLEINTLKNAIYLSMHNDVSFIIDAQMSLYEHQSTYNPNLPLRYLMYLSDLYSNYTKDMNIYGSKALTLPEPRFIIFYNGKEKRPDVQELYLSDMFAGSQESPSVELHATMLNINRGHNKWLMDRCPTLRDYAEYTARVREYAEEMPLEQAVEQAITECIREGILEEFLKKNRAEAYKVSLYEYDEEKVRRLLERSAREEGWEEGREQGVLETARKAALNMHRKGYPGSDIAELLEVSVKNVQQWIAEGMTETVGYGK